MRDVCSLIWLAPIGLFRSRASLQAEILTLRHQLNVLRRNPQITSLELDQGRGTRSGARFALHERFAAFAILMARLGKGVSLEPRPLDPKIPDLAPRLFDLP